jgi:hypothetical protein
MSSEMDPKSETLDAAVAVVGGVREWPGVSQAEAVVRFPREDGGRSLSEVAERDPDAALQVLAERARTMTDATGAAIALGTSKVMVCRASAGDSAPPVGAELQVESGLSGESVRTRKTLCCDDAQTDERVNRESCEALGIASVVVLPMVEGSEVVGVFELFSDRAYAFGVTDIKALERLAAMALEARRKSTSGEAVLEQAGTGAPASTITAATNEPVAAEAVIPSETHPIQVTIPAVEEALQRPSRPAKAAGNDSRGIAETMAVSAVTTGSVPESAATAVLRAAPAKQEQKEDSTSRGPSPFTADPAKAEARVATGSLDTEDVLDTKAESNQAGRVTLSLEKRAEESSGNEPVLEAHDEHDPGEMVRDAAERTAAWKASLLEGIEEEAPQPEHFTFHMHGPRAKTPVATASAQQTGEEEQNARPAHTILDPKKVPSAPVTAKESAPAAAVTTPVVEAAGAAETGQLCGVIVGTSGAAVAPALKKVMEKPEGAQAAPVAAPPVDVAIPAPPEKPASPEASTGATKAVKPLARPASAEGRSKFAVAQLKRCESCGFPVSGGRQYCLDCERHQAAKDEVLKRSAESKKAAEPAASATAGVAAAEAKVESSVQQVVAAAATASQPSSAKSEKETKKESEQKEPPAALVTKPAAEKPKPETAAEKNKPAAVAKSEPAPEPHFMVTPPNQYESWILSNMYTAVAIAIVVIGAVVYLVSR